MPSTSRTSGASSSPRPWRPPPAPATDAATRRDGTAAARGADGGRAGGAVEVINTGLSGLRAIHHLATLKAILAHEPDLGRFLIGANDCNRQARRRFDPPGWQHQPVLGLSFEDTLLWVALSNAFHRGRGLLNAYAGPKRKARTRLERGAYDARRRGARRVALLLAEYLAPLL